MLTLLEALICKGYRGMTEHLLCTQGVGGSNPPVSTTRKALQDKAFRVILSHR